MDTNKENISSNLIEINDNKSRIINITEKYVLKNTFFTRYIEESREIINSLNAIQKNSYGEFDNGPFYHILY